jgi:hypothetical protein
MRKVGYVLGALLLTAVAFAPALAQQPFSDVPTNHWAYNAVNDLAEQGLLEGYPDGTFKGKQALTRYEFAQAIARMLDRLEAMKGIAGPAGPPGPPGPPGAGGGLTPEQQATLDKLAKEFGPELQALRSDLNALTKRVEDLEAKPAPEMPKVTVTGMTSWRAGLYGTDFGTQDISTTGYPFFAELIVDESGVTAPYGGINVPGFGAIPISDALKDSFKASDFMTMKTKVNFSSALTDKVDANVTLLAGPESNTFQEPVLDLILGSPTAFSGNGLMDVVTVDEAWLKYRTRFIAPVEFTVGKQYFARGKGLLVDNDQEAIKAFKADWTSGDFSWGAIFGMLDREQFWARTTGSVGLPDLDPNLGGLPDPETSGQDNYNIYTVDWRFADSWKLGGTYLASGFNEEKGWSVDLHGKAWDIKWYGEYGQLLDWPTGMDFNDLDADGVEDPGETPLDDSDNAWLAGLKWGNNFVNITGEYGQVDAGYAFSIPGGGWSAINPLLSAAGMYTDLFNLPLSRLHPNAEVDPHDINWVDRPLFLDPTNIARGWHVNVTFPTLLGDNTPLSIAYSAGDGYDPAFLSWLLSGGSNSGVAEPDKWRDADPVWIVKLSRQFSENVSANVIYGRREVDNIMSPQEVPIFDEEFAEQDPIQVIRAEVCVAF